MTPPPANAGPLALAVGDIAKLVASAKTPKKNETHLCQIGCAVS